MVEENDAAKDSTFSPEADSVGDAVRVLIIVNIPGMSEEGCPRAVVELPINVVFGWDPRREAITFVPAQVKLK